jgi:photosystem II stability/assembly factor-like uncharacterized protein
MKKYVRFVLISSILALSANHLIAQYVVKETFFETSGISNQGVVSGYENQAGPYSLWNPDQNTFVEIGGAAPGSGVGGRARFSEDGLYISGSSYTEWFLDTEWQRNVLTDYNYIFKAIDFPEDQTNFGYVAGQSVTYNGHGIVLRTTNGGTSWSEMWVDNDNRGLEAMSFPSMFTGYVGGWNQYFAKTQNGGWDWEVLTPGAGDDVYIYTSIEFKDDNNGVVTAQLDNGSAVYITSDGGSTWTTGSGLLGVPTKVRHAGGDTYFLSTNNGRVQKSTDNGLTWTSVLHYPGVLFLGLNFHDEMTGYVLAETYISKTTDGGANWVESSVSPATVGVLWRDIAWIDEDNLVIVGTPDMIYQSNDGGATWFWGNEELFNGNPALYEIAVTNNAVHVCGSQGNIYILSLVTSITGAEMSRYNTSTQEWSVLGSLGYIVDNTTSSGYNISGDGTTIVGNSYVVSPNTHAQAVVWTEETGVISLGTLHSGRSTRADGVSFDGSVIVGYQDFNGPWKSAVWRKNPDGGYFPNEYLLIDPNGSSTDEMNQLGQASAVSANGIWIGGYGDFAHNNPWIWSEATGLVDLGSMGLEPGTIGRVAAINHDGSIVVGWYRYSPDPWTNIYTPFIWTPALGAQNLNTFITETLGFTMEIGPIWNANVMSSNGKYIGGWGVDPNIGPWGEIFTFRLELPSWFVGIDEILSSSNTIVYPNPVKDQVNITSDLQIEKIELYNVNGQLLLSEIMKGSNNTINMSSMTSGIYILKAISNNSSKSFKVIKE